MAQRLKGTIEDEGSSTALGRLPFAMKLDREAGQLAQPRGTARPDRMASANEQRSMHSIRGHGIRRREFPVWKDRLHHLIAERDPFDARKQRSLVHVGYGRGLQAEHDLRLDAR